jgi:predicted MFS family arabinose efflux permease
VLIAFSIGRQRVTVKYMMTVTRVRTDAAPVALAMAGCGAVAVGFGFARYGFGLFASTFRAEFGLTTSTIGAVSSAASVMYLVALLSSGALTARYGPRLPVLLANMAAVAGLALIACAGDTPMLVAGVVIAAASSGMVWGPFADAVRTGAEPRWQDPALSIISSGTTFGLIIAGGLALWTADRPGQTWRVIWLAFAALAAAVALIAYRAMTDRNTAASPPRQQGKRFRPTAEALPLCLISALYGAAGAVFFTFAVDMVRGEGLSPRWGALLWLLVGLGGISGIATGAAVGRIGLGPSLRAVVAVLAASIAGLAVSPSNAGIAALAALTFGVAYMPFAALLAIWNQRLHPRHATSGLVLSLFCLGVGAVAGPAVMGVIAQASGLRIAFMITAAILLAGGLPLCRRVAL